MATRKQDPLSANGLPPETLSLPGVEPTPKRKYIKVNRRVPKEKTVVDAIMKWLKTLPNVKAEKTHGSGFANAGKPDISGAVGPVGLRFELEVKRPGGGKLTELQRAMLAQWNAIGVTTGVVTSLEEATFILSPLFAKAQRIAELLEADK